MNEVTEKIIFLSGPISSNDLMAIQHILKKNDVMVSHINRDIFDVYDVFKYREQLELHRTKFKTLIDRNIFTEIIKIVRGDSHITDSMKVSAAVLSFLQYCDVVVEPNIALYELAATSSDAAVVNEELRLFRIADNVHPQEFVNIALGRTVRITQREIDLAGKLSTNSSHVDFSSRLRLWSYNYTMVLKLSLLELQLKEQYVKMEEFMRWMFYEYFMGAPMIIFANYFFKNAKGFRVKKIKSLNRGRTIDGVRNATWDLMLIQQWAKNVLAKDDSIWLLCSRDIAVRRMASCLFVSGTAQIADDSVMVRNMFVECWGDKKGLKLWEQYRYYEKNKDDVSRVANRQYPYEYFEEMRITLEKELLS